MHSEGRVIHLLYHHFLITLKFQEFSSLGYLVSLCNIDTFNIAIFAGVLVAWLCCVSQSGKNLTLYENNDLINLQLYIRFYDVS